jgi:DNA polymerase III alpha subunit (gram-positive type)
MQSSVIEICGANVSTCFLSCPSNPKQTLGVKMPFLVLLIKYLKKYFTFEVQVIDDKNVKRRFRASNYQSNTRVKPFICTIPMKLDEGWNQIHFNLTDFTRRAYGTNYLETLRVQIHANCRIRRIYFTDQLLSSKSIPDEYRAFSNANDDNAEEQYQNQMANDPNAQMMQGEGGEEQYQAEYHEENQEEHQVVENNEEHQEEHHEEHQVEQNEEPKAEAPQEGNAQGNQEQPPQENNQQPPQEQGGNPPAEQNQGGEQPANAEQPAQQ